jgi:Putative transmembrane protein (Alph_Pro_TM)
MRNALALALAALLFLPGLRAVAADAPRSEQVQSDISNRDISIQSNFTGIEIVLFGAIDFSRGPSPEGKPYDVIMVIRGPNRPMVVRRKEQIAGLWMNGPSKTFAAVPGFYAVLASRPFRAVTSEAVLKKLGIGFSNLKFDKPAESKTAESKDESKPAEPKTSEPTAEPKMSGGMTSEGNAATGKTADDKTADDGFRASLIRLQQERGLFLESDDAVRFLGRSLFRGSVKLPVNVPIGLYTTQVFLFRDGKLLSQSQSSLQVEKVGVERVVYMLAFHHPFAYGLLAVLMAVSFGLFAWVVFRRE